MFLRPEDAQEYISSFSYGTSSWQSASGEYLRQLPASIDDISTYLREDIYEQMLLDAQVKSNLNILVHGILGGGIQVIPASDSQRDLEVAQFIDRCLNEYMETDLLTEVLPDLLRSMVLGYRIAEKVYYRPDESPENGKQVLKRIKVKERRSAFFLVDGMMNVQGIVGLIPPDSRDAALAYRNVTLLDSNFDNLYYGGNQVVFPRDKFVIMSWQTVNGDPRGTSIARSAYDAWWFKQQIKPEYLKYLATYAIGFLYGTLPENANRRRTQLNADGTQVVDGDNVAVGASDADKMLAVLENIQNASVGVFPFGTTVSSLQNTSNGEPFIMALDFFNHEITKAMTGQIMATESTTGGGKAAGIHENILDLPLTYGTLATQAVLQRDVVNPLIRLNYSRLVRPPKVRIPGMNLKDFLQLSSAFAKLSLAGLLSPSQFPEMWNTLGVVQPSAENLDKLTQEYWKKMESKSQTATASLAGDSQNVTKNPEPMPQK